MLAISVMSATAQSIFFIVAVVAFVLAAIGFEGMPGKFNLIALGLAAYLFVLAWNSLAAT